MTTTSGSSVVQATPRSRAIDEATNASSTFQRLVATIEASNGIVYVEPGKCAERVPACLPAWMQSSGSYRFMRIVIDLKRLNSERVLMGAIGHELQHAIEVLSDVGVTDGSQMFFFYGRYAPTGRKYFETPAAIDAGMAVEDELRAWRRMRVRVRLNRLRLSESRVTARCHRSERHGGRQKALPLLSVGFTTRNREFVDCNGPLQLNPDDRLSESQQASN